MSPASGRARPQTPDGLECPQAPDRLECPQAPDGLIFSGWALIISAQPALVSGRSGARTFAALFASRRREWFRGWWGCGWQVVHSSTTLRLA
ncbi:hypothetical protein C0Q60_16785 [Streptomyces albidoflavus]|nr:hypothetical protein C0Q60_16785 [Streptomyces albidoflavus]RZD96254.1 hypothetical protein C0Q62_16660 [Streptomyces albidoflavus]